MENFFFITSQRLVRALRNMDEKTEKGLHISDYFPETESAYDSDGIEIQVTVMRPTRIPDKPHYEASLWRRMPDTTEQIQLMIEGA